MQTQNKIIKTLKDINRIDKDWLEGAISYKELKAEAVKWVKQNDFWVDKDWIKHFFNLTDGDLK